ncbi:MAG: competence/damage-inducible protein A [Halanaerobium sp.]
MKTAIVATGSELIRGLVQDSNSKFLAENLNNLGFENKNILVCGDEKEDIKINILSAAQRADLIFITGGLGPTKDDLTKDAFAEAFDLKLFYSEEIENKLKNIFCNHHSKMTSNNLSQAYLPAGAEIIDNEKGTAPALKIKLQDKFFYLLPGVPSELKYLFNEKIISDLKKLTKNKILIKEFNFIGIGESTLASKIEAMDLNPALETSYQAGKAEVKLRIKIKQDAEIEAGEKKKIIKEAKNQIKKEFKDFIYGENQQTILDKVHKKLISKNLSIATAESFTGGLIAERLTKKAGSSQYFLGSIVAYNQKIKKELLNIEQEILTKYGVVSRECVKAMAENAAAIFNSKIAVATTGAAGPEKHDGKSAGTMFVSLFYQGQIKIFKIEKNYGRELNRFYASQIALFEIYKLINESEDDLNV